MSDARTLGSVAPAVAERPLTELELRLVPLDFVTEWVRCGETADYLGRFFAHDFTGRETAASVLSTVLNELIENLVKFSDDKNRSALLRLRQYGDHLRIEAMNQTSAARAEAFAEVFAQLISADPEALFIERIAAPPEIGGPGIGLIMLRKDYGAELGVRLTPTDATCEVTVQVIIPNAEVEQR